MTPTYFTVLLNNVNPYMMAGSEISTYVAAGAVTIAAMTVFLLISLYKAPKSPVGSAEQQQEHRKEAPGRWILEIFGFQQLSTRSTSHVGPIFNPATPINSDPLDHQSTRSSNTTDHDEHKHANETSAPASQSNSSVRARCASWNSGQTDRTDSDMPMIGSSAAMMDSAPRHRPLSSSPPMGTGRIQTGTESRAGDPGIPLSIPGEWLKLWQDAGMR